MTYKLVGVFEETEKADAAIVELQQQGFNSKDMSIVLRDGISSESMSSIAELVNRFQIPGLGTFLLGGPIASDTLSGGLIGQLITIGLSGEDAVYYEQKVNTQGVLIAISCGDQDVVDVEQIMDSFDATDIKRITTSPTEPRLMINGSEPMFSFGVKGGRSKK